MDALLEQIVTESPSVGPFRNYNFQPEKIQISSDSDPNVSIRQNPNEECFYSQYTVPLPRPALDIKGIQMTRASIPNPQTNLPNTECTFFYYRVNAAYLVPPDPTNIFIPQQLHMVRLLPSWYKQELNPDSGLYAFNKTFPDYEALNNELKKACLNDPINDFNSLFIPGDISLTYDISMNKFRMTGNNTFVDNAFVWAYIPAGYLDPNVAAAQQLLQSLSQEYDSFGPYPPQPFQLYKTLNLRLGFTWDGANLNLFSAGTQPTSSGINDVLAYRFRPPISFVVVDPNLQDVPGDNTYTAESYANLVYTNCVNLFASFVAGASTDSIRNTQLLASVPMNAQNLGVSFYNPVIPKPLTKILPEIYQITIQMFTDTGEPYDLPNSAITSVEFALTY